MKPATASSAAAGAAGAGGAQQGGNWDPGWPPAGAKVEKQAAKRMRPPPEPEEDKRDPKSKVATLEELTKVVEQLWAERPGNFKVRKEATDVINDHASRLDEMEHQDMQ